MKTVVFLLCIFALVGCHDSQSDKSQNRHVEEADVSRPPEMIITFETMAETLALVGTESKNSKDIANDRAIETWYGKTLGNLGVVRAVTIPHKGTGTRNRDLEVTKKHILTTLDTYVLVDYEKFHSSTHIPLGAFVKIEYRNDIVGWINFFGGVPYTVELTKNNTTGRYGLRRISEPRNLPDKK